MITKIMYKLLQIILKDVTSLYYLSNFYDKLQAVTKIIG